MNGLARKQTTNDRGTVLHFHQFDNGLVLLGEPMPWTESVSFSLLVPYGPVLDPPDRDGLASMVCEMSLRGAGNHANRDFIQTLENLGCETSESVSHLHTGYGASLLAANLLPALGLLADVVRRPHFDENQLESARQVLKQDIYSLEDDPARRLMLELHRNFWPDPWGRSSLGTLETIDRIEIADVRRQHARYFQPEGAILSIAGKFDWNLVDERVGELFGDWKARPFEIPAERMIGRNSVHISLDSAQTHIGLAYPTETLRSADYMPAWCGVGVLSGGMSSRLFDEIREKRGLCYSVYAVYSTLRDRAGVFCYCGTGTERAAESLEVLLAELDKLSRGIEEDELRRLKIGARSSLVMQQESTGARSASMTRDWYHLGRIRSLEEIEKTVLSLTKDQIDDYLASHPAGPFHIVTLGREPLSRE